MAVRKAITRSKRTFRVKFPSRKNDRTIHCEAPLEAKAALFLEISPYVKAFQEQPTVTFYYDGTGVQRRYVPDFEARLEDDSVVHIEVKPVSQLRRASVKRKLDLIARRYEEQKQQFRVMSERELCSEPLHANLRHLFSFGRARRKDSDVRRDLKLLKEATFSTIADASAVLGGENVVFYLIAKGHLAADLRSPLESSSEVWFRETAGGEDDPLCI